MVQQTAVILATYRCKNNLYLPSAFSTSKAKKNTSMWLFSFESNKKSIKNSKFTNSHVVDICSVCLKKYVLIVPFKEESLNIF